MFSRFGKIVAGLALLAPCAAMADIIHWQLHSGEDAPTFLGENFVLSGGFDFDTETNVISNITVRTSAVGCVACNDFSDGGTGVLGAYPDGRSSVIFTEEYGASGDILGREYWLQIYGNTTFGEETSFDVTQPNTQQDLSLWHHGLVRVDNPLDPEIFEDVSCEKCVYAIGTLAPPPMPEPETYAMLLSGLGILGWQARRKVRR